MHTNTHTYKQSLLLFLSIGAFPSLSLSRLLTLSRFLILSQKQRPIWTDDCLRGNHHTMNLRVHIKTVWNIEIWAYYVEYMSNLMGSIQYASTIWWFYENELINSWTFYPTVNMNALFPMLTMLAILLNFNCFYCYICIIRIGNTFNYAKTQYWNDRSQLPEWDVSRISLTGNWKLIKKCAFYLRFIFKNCPYAELSIAFNTMHAELLFMESIYRYICEQKYITEISDFRWHEFKSKKKIFSENC